MPLEFDGVNGIIKNTTSDGDVTIKGNDGGSEISALTFDISDQGTATFNHDVKLGDSSELVFGAGNDLKIYHDGSNSYITDVGTGGLYLKANADFVVQSQGSDENMIYGASNAFVKLYHNGNEKIATTSTGIDVTGTVTATGTSVFASLDISGDIDVDGTTNLDVVDIDGAVDMASTLVVASNTGIGESSPDTRLHVTETIDVAYSADNFTIDANALLKLENPSTTGAAFSAIQFRTGSGADLFFGGVQGSGNEGAFIFGRQGSPDLELVNIAHNGATTITTADNTDTLTLTSTDADAAVGPNLRLYRNSGSPADSDSLGMIDFEGRNDNSQDVVYGQIETLTTDVSDGAEDGYMNLSVMLAGTLRSRIEMDSGETVINEASQDLNFRVESDGNTNMLFVNGGDNAVGIGTNVTNSRRLAIGTGGAKTSTSTHYPMNIGQTNEASSHAGLNVYFVGGASAAVRKWQFQPVENGVANDGIIEVNPNGGRFKAVQGIQLGGDTDANKLDDYETGTFTPTINGTASAPSGVTYNKRLGWYEKIGDMVTVHVHLDAASMTAVPSGALTVTGLPFTCVNTTGFLHAGVVSLTSNFASTEAPQANYINPNTTALNFLCNDSNDARDNIGDAITCANAMSGNETFIASCTYRSA